MTAISKAWVTIGDTAVDPDSPIDSVLMTGMRDDLVHLREWLGASFFAGAIQDHNHDGTNSAAVAGGIGTMKPWPGIALPGATWDWCDGGTLSRSTYAGLFAVLMKQATITMTIASPCVVTWTAHGFRTNHPIRFFTSGALPTGITAGTHGGPGVGTEYFVKVIDANTFNIAATPGGTNINTSGTQSGTHTGVCAPHGDGDGSTTFHKPDIRGRVPAGRDDMGGTAANRITVANTVDARLTGKGGGTELHTITNGQMANTSVQQGGSATWWTGAGAGAGPAIGDPGAGGGAGATGTVNGSNQGHPNVQPIIVEDWIIQIS